MEHLSVRCFVLDLKHIFLGTTNIRYKPCFTGFLIDVPDDLLIGLTTLIECLASGPEFREVEFVLGAFVIETTEKFSF